MKICLLFFITLFTFTMANVQPVFEHNSQDNGQNNNRRLGLGLNAGFESPVGSAGFGLYPRGNLIQDDLLYPIIVGLGLLSFVNLVLTVLIPAVKDILPNNNKKDEDVEDEENEEGERGMRAMFDLNNVDALELVDMAQSVLTAINSIGNQYEQ